MLINGCDAAEVEKLFAMMSVVMCNKVLEMRRNFHLAW